MTIYRGTYYAQPFQMKDASGAAINLTGWTFESDFRITLNGEEIENFTSADGGFAVTNAVLGIFELRMTADRTLALPLGSLIFDVLRTDGDPGPVWLFASKVKVADPVTRDESP